MQKRKVIKQLNILAIIVIAAFLFFAIIYGTFMNKRLQESVDSRMLNEVNVIAKEVNLYFSKHTEIVNQMKNNNVLIDYVKMTESDGIYNNQYDAFLKTVQNIRQSTDELSLVWVGLVEENYIVADETDFKIDSDYDIRERPWFIEMIEDGTELILTKPYADISSGEMVISIVSPIYDNGRLVGSLGVDILLDDLVTFVSEYSVDESGHAMLLSRENEYVVLPEITLSSQVEQQMNDESGLFEVSLDEDYRISYQRTELYNWVVGFVILDDEVTYSTQLFKNIGVFIFFVAVVMIVVLIILIRMSDNFDELNMLYAKLTKKEKALKQSNETVIAAFNQVQSSEEELRAQYNEIQEYLKRIEELKDKYDLAVELTHIAVWEYNIEDKTIMYNNAFFIDDKSIEGTFLPMHDSMMKILSEEDLLKLNKSLEDYLNHKTEELFCQITRNGDWYLILGRRTDEHRLNGIIMDVTKMKKQEIAISKMANLDPLTGLPNRRNFKDMLKFTLDNDQSGAVIMLDLDNFKEINDTMGHVFGDAVLENIAERLRNLACENIYVSRFGGDEFLIHISSECEIEVAIGQIVDTIRKKMIIEGEHIVISMSMGITLYPEDSSTVDDLIMNADLAMYSVKKSGRNSYAYFTRDMKENLKERSEIEKELYKALENNAFKVVYQPQYDTQTGQVISYEALLRIQNNVLSPAKFIPIAEECGMIIPIGQWVIKEVIRQVSVWQKTDSVKPVAVNFSVKQIHDSEFTTVLEDALTHYQVDASNIEIEITESVFFEDKKETIKFMTKLKSLGHTIALDDFGTGYSSLNYLTYLPLDKLKLDKSLMDRFLDTHEEFISHVIDLAHCVDLKVVAEGIETKEQYEKLKQVKCDIIQGYYFSEPLEADDIKSA